MIESGEEEQRETLETDPVADHEKPTVKKSSCCWCCKKGSTYNEVSKLPGDAEWEALLHQWKIKWQGFLKRFNLQNKNKDFGFDLLLQLYAHDPVLEKLHDMYDSEPQEFAFYLPQLCNFLIHSPEHAPVSKSLQDLILDKSQRSLWFAQHVIWFLRSFAIDKLERKEKLLKAVAEKGEIAAKNIHVFDFPRQVVAPIDSGDFTRLTPLKRGPPYIIGTSKVDWALSFFEELTHCADNLHEVNPKLRNKILRNSLASLEKDYFPCEAMFLPVGVSTKCRVVGIICEESFCFSTNERVPYMICLEVIDHERKDKSSTTPWSEMKDLGSKIKHSINKGMKELEGWGQKQLALNGVPPRKARSNTTNSDLGSPLSESLSSPGMGQRRATEAYPSSDLEYHNVPGATPEATPTRAREESLGRWVPESNPARGRGFSHFEHHKDVSETVKRKLVEEIEMKTTLGVAADHENLEDNTSSTSPAKKLDFENGGVSIPSSEEAVKPDEEVVAFKEPWREKEDRIRTSRSCGNIPGWRLVPLIIKSNDDLRQEQLALQLIKQFDRIFRDRGLSLRLHPYDVLATTETSGIIQAVPDTISLDSLKKNDPNYMSLKVFFTRFYNSEEKFATAQKHFCEGLAAYCLVSYLLQIKDRHNGNLLLHADGYLIHIDFGFILSNSPGNANFERAPFKLTNEFVQVLGGPDSSQFRRFRRLMAQGFLAARKRSDEIILMLEMMIVGNEHLPCFQAGGAATVESLRERFQLGLSKAGCVDFVNSLIDTATNHWRTTLYDRYQRCCVGIAY